MSGVSGRVALVTGCGSADGIGFAVARALVAGAARVAITATGPRVHQRAVELGGVFAAQADLADPAAVAELVEAVVAQLGPIAILVNNAGMVQSGLDLGEARVEAIGDGDWQRHLALNATTAFHTIRAVLPGMQAAGYGRIVNIASVTGPLVAIEGAGGYGAGKAAMVGLTRAVALENAARGITCNAVLPGWIATASSTEAEMRAARASPARRAGRPDEVAACVLFLAGAEASFVNGAALVVDGANTLVEMKHGGQ